MQLDILLKEIKFKAIRSSGPGGQHVNKSSTKVALSFHIESSEALSEIEKHRLFLKLKSRISSDGMLILQSGETRSQYRNKAIVIERFVELLTEKIKVARPRKKTKPSKSKIESRLKIKKVQALKKRDRKPPEVD